MKKVQTIQIRNTFQRSWRCNLVRSILKSFWFRGVCRVVSVPTGSYSLSSINTWICFLHQSHQIKINFNKPTCRYIYYSFSLLLILFFISSLFSFYSPLPSIFLTSLRSIYPSFPFLFPFLSLSPFFHSLPQPFLFTLRLLNCWPSSSPDNEFKGRLSPLKCCSTIIKAELPNKMCLSSNDTHIYDN